VAVPAPPLELWVRELAQRQMPTLARTAERIASKANEVDSSASELAALILQDVAMTTRLLRMANSIHFNPHGGKINTVSRAIVLLGFNTVRDLCLSIAILDSFLNGPHRERVASEMALAFHAAMQARSLAQLRRQRDPEEVFVATLLSHLGELAFLCFAGEIQPDLLARLQQARTQPGNRDAQERAAIGFALRDLTAQLNREWRLSGLLAVALDPHSAQDERSQSLQHGNRLAEALREGIDSAAAERAVADIARALGMRVDELAERVWDTARAAADTAAALGAVAAARLIPQRQPRGRSELREAPPAPGWNAGDAMLQLGILRELSQLLVDARPSVGNLMEMVLEGIYRGIGMDRALFALVTPDRRRLRSKSLLCAASAALPQPFDFALGGPVRSTIERVMQGSEPVWVGGPATAGLPVDPLTAALCGGQCFLMPLSVSGTPIGCLYADRRPSGRPLSEELFAQFRLFGQQAQLGLGYLKAR
jgi:HD-like signal output (HDOD) protein